MIDHQTHMTHSKGFHIKKTGYIFTLSYLIFGAFLAFIPEQYLPITYITNSIMNALHFPSGIALYVFIHWLLKWKIKSPWVSVSICILVLIALEFVQPYVNRTRSLDDFLWGSAGALIAHIYLMFKRSRVLLTILTAILMVVCLFPVIQKTARLYALHDRLPTLFTFDDESEFDFFTINTEEKINIYRDELDKKSYMRVSLAHTRWPGVSLINPEIDFSAYAWLCFDARLNAGADIHVRLDDSNSTNYMSRAHVTKMTSTEWQPHCIQLQRLTSPDGKLIDLANITRVVFFVSGNDQLQYFDLDTIAFKR